MIDERPRLEVPRKTNAKALFRRIRPALWITLPVLLLSYPFLMDGLAPILWGKAPSNIPGVLKCFQIPDQETGEELQSDLPRRWSVDTELFIDREDGDAIYVFPEGGRSTLQKGPPPPLFRLNLKTGSIDRVANTDPLAFISAHCMGFRSLGQLGQAFSGVSLPVFAPSWNGTGWFRQSHRGRDHITLRMSREDLPLGDIPILGDSGQFPGIVEGFQDPSRRCLLLHADEWLIVLRPDWRTKLPSYPWASVRASSSDWSIGTPNPTRSAELTALDGRWVVKDSIRLEGSAFPLRDISLLVSPPRGFSFSSPGTEPFEALSSGDPILPAMEQASKVTWKDVPEGRVFTISHLPYDGRHLVLPIRFQGPKVTPSTLPLDPYSATNDLQHPSNHLWLFQAGSISFMQGPGAAPPPALEGKPWFDWYCELPLAPAQGQVWAPDRR